MNKKDKIRYSCIMWTEYLGCLEDGPCTDGFFSCTKCEFDYCYNCFLMEAGLKKAELKKSYIENEAKKEAKKKEEKEEKKEEGEEKEFVDHKHLKITFCSGDKDEEAYNDYYKTMPWDTMGYDKDEYKKLQDKYGINGIPALILLKEDGTMVHKQCRGDVSKGPMAMMDWIKKLSP